MDTRGTVLRPVRPGAAECDHCCRAHARRRRSLPHCVRSGQPCGRKDCPPASAAAYRMRFHRAREEFSLVTARRGSCHFVPGWARPAWPRRRSGLR
jgi:hypothetical protein